MPTPVRASVTSSGPNAETVGTSVGLPARGFLQTVTVLTEAPSGGVPHGRVYARVVIVAGAAAATAGVGNILAVVWAGYVVTGAPSSFPEYALADGLSLAIIIDEGTNGAATDRFVAVATVAETTGGAPFIFYEPPFAGAGERFTITIGAPAGNADPANVTIPALVRERLLGFGSSLVTDATVGSRQISHSVQNAGGVECQGGGCAVNVAPSTTIFVRTLDVGTGPTSAEGTTSATTETVNGNTPYGPHPAGFISEIVTRHKGAADSWTQSRLYVEEWACPNP